MFNAEYYVGIISFILAITVGISNPCLAENILNFGSISDSAPLSFNDGGTVKGFLPDVFRETARRAGFDIKLKLFPIKRLEYYLQTGDIDGTVYLLPTESRREYITFSDSPIMTSRTVVFVKKGREFPFDTISDLFGKKIGVVLGWIVTNKAMEQAVQEGKIVVDNAPGHDLNLKKLIAGRVDCVIGTEQATSYHANELGISRDIEVLKTPISEISAFFGISKHTKNIVAPRSFMEDMNEMFNELISDGTYEKIMRQYELTLSD